MRAMQCGVMVALGGLVGCIGEDALPRPDIEHATIAVAWSSPTSRYVAVSVPEIPCVGTEDDLLGEDGVECVSAPWTVTIDGLALEPRTITCEAAHEGLFGPVAKSCYGDSTTSPLGADSTNEDIDVVIATGGEEVRHTLHGLRRSYSFTQESAADPSVFKAGIVRVDDVALEGTSYAAYFGSRRGDARIDLDNTGRLTIEPPFATDPGVYPVRILASTRDGDAKIGVPIDGTLTVE